MSSWSPSTIPYRYVICVVSTLVLTLILCNLYILNFTVLCMVDEEGDVIDLNITHPLNSSSHSRPQFEYSKWEKDLLFSAGYLGPMPAMIPLYILVGKYGVRKVLTICGLISAIFTALSPPAAYSGFNFLFASRIMQGIAVAVLSPAISVITSHWSTLAQNGVFVSVLCAHFQISPLITMPMSAALCVSPWGWTGVYYLHAFLTFAITIIFWIVYTDSPTDNRFTSYIEAKEIDLGKTHEEKHNGEETTPYAAIFKSPAVWAIWITSVGGTIGFSIFLQYGPTYLNKVLHYSLKTTGWSAAVPYIFSCLARIFAQPISANCDFLGERLAVILTTTLSQGTMAISFIVLVFIPEEWVGIAQLCYTLVIVANGLNGVGITRSAQLVCKQHLRFVYTIRGFANSSVGLFLPLFVNFMAPDDTHKQWLGLFLCIFCITLGTNILFAFLADIHPAPWTKGTVEVDITHMEENQGEDTSEFHREAKEGSFKYQKY